MDRLIVEGVRCFHSRQVVPLAPITFLLGENSSGKTTFLALARLAWDTCNGVRPLDFNEAPFMLGSYDQIASYRGGKAGRAKRFVIGAEVDRPPTKESPPSRRRPIPITALARFVARGAQPQMTEWSLASGKYRLSIQFTEPATHPVVTVSSPSGSFPLEGIPFLEPSVRLPELMRVLPFLLHERFRSSPASSIPPTKTKPPSRDDLEAFSNLAEHLFERLGRRPYAFAPIRTRPQRTYDILKDIREPEGSHVPMLLAKIHTSDPEEWERLRKALVSFGQTSGLFTNLEVKRMGRKESDPFQIRVKLSGPAFNLVDVGYGVSQVLPIIVDVLQSDRAPRQTTFLLQQPEVHLHPRAQAELGSFLALLARSHGKRFIIETHSDFLIDRVRAEIRNNRGLSPEDVLFLFFSRDDGGVSISPIRLDKSGNILNPPPGYRQFFNLIDVFTAPIVSGVRISFGVFVGKDASTGFQYCRAYIIL